MAGLKGEGGPPGNMNAFKHGLAVIADKTRLNGATNRPSEQILADLPI